MVHFIRRAYWSALDKAMGVVMMLALFIYMFGGTIGAVEGALHPVVTEAILLKNVHTPPPRYRYQWEAKSTKLRDCTFVSIDWWLGKRGLQSTQVTAFFLDAPLYRPKGGVHWNQLVIDLDPRQVIDGSYAYVYHRCPLISIPKLDIRIMEPWLVRSLFYNSWDDSDTPAGL